MLRRWRAPAIVMVTSLLIALFQPIGVAPAATAVNGGFETGNLTGWTAANACGSGNWFAYSGTAAPLSNNPIDAPPEGTFAAVSDQQGPGTQIMYQDIALEPGETHLLSFSHYYRNHAGVFDTPNTLSCGERNQQYRVDLVRTTAPIDSVAPADVLATIFRTEADAPAILDPTAMSFDLTPFAGQTVRLRFAVAETVFFFNASVDDVVVRSSHTLNFFLHGNDIPGTAGGFTMNQTPAPAQTLSLNLLNAPSWFSEPTLTGTFHPGATFQLRMPCTLGLGVLITYSLAATDPSGGNVQPLGQTTQPLNLCVGQQTITIPVATPVTLSNQRLKLTISSVLSVTLNLQLGTNTFLRATRFIGTP